MSDTFGGDADNQAYVYLNLLMSFIAAVSSLAIIYLIHYMKLNTGHVTLVYWMSWFQLAYDVTFFFSNVNCGYYVTTAANFIQLSSGIAASLISNWIAFVAFYIITYRLKCDIINNLPLVLSSSLVPGLVDGIVLLVASVPKSKENVELSDISILYVYYYTRVFSIFLNFVFCGITIYQIQLISSGNMSGSRLSSSSTQSKDSSLPWYSLKKITNILTGNSPNKHMSVQEVAIRTLAFRMIYYPIVQAVSRSGYSWYEAVYGSRIDDIGSNPKRYSASIFLTIITPIASVGYLWIFLAMQPRAYRTLVNILYCREDLEHNTTRSTRHQSRTTSMISGMRSAKSNSMKKSTGPVSFFDWNDQISEEASEMQDHPPDMRFNPSMVSTTSTITTSSDNIESGPNSLAVAKKTKNMNSINDDDLMDMIAPPTSESNEGLENNRRSSLFGKLLTGWKKQKPLSTQQTSGIGPTLQENDEANFDSESRFTESVAIDARSSAPYDQEYSISMDEGLHGNLSIFSTSSSTYGGESFMDNKGRFIGDISMSLESNDVLNMLHDDQKSNPIPIPQQANKTQPIVNRSSASMTFQQSWTGAASLSPIVASSHLASSTMSTTSAFNLSEDEQL